MESLNDVLLTHKELIGNIAGIFTIAQFFSGVLLCKEIYQRNTTKGVSAVPFIGAIAIGICVFKYALILNDDAMLRVNIASVVLNLSYVTFYVQYSENPWEDVYKPSSYALAIVTFVLEYAQLESKEQLEIRYGLLVTVLQLLVLASPLVELAHIIESKDATPIPLPLTIMATIVSFLWLIYAIILKNIFMMTQNFIGFILCLVQLGLVYIYGRHFEESN